MEDGEWKATGGTGPIAVSPHPCYNTHSTTSPSEQRVRRGEQKGTHRVGARPSLHRALSRFTQEGQAR
jgi:hypothetical protein